LFRPAGAADRAAVDRAIDLVGLTQRSHDSVDTLSGGQQQRVLIARAAAGEPDLLVLDEPNAGVDRRSQDVFARALRTFVATGRAVVVVLHELGPIEPLIDRCVILDGGRVAYDGPRPVPATATGPAGEHHHEQDETGLFG
jgi:zinc transport system ATP-binding protein